MIDWIAEVMRAKSARRLARIQTLWSGYGEVFRVALDGGIAPTAIVKHVKPPRAARGTTSDRRKRRSYDVEAVFYRDFASRLPGRTARLYGDRVRDDEWLFVLEDLGDRRTPSLPDCLAWLASFHRTFMSDRGDGLWPTGTYWYLETRIEEVVTDLARARALDHQLAGASYQTLVHGDAKEENFCIAPDGEIAAYDFQYVGRGCGIRDVAYLLHGHRDIERHLAHYFAALGAPRELEDEWRALYPIAVADFERFLDGWQG